MPTVAFRGRVVPTAHQIKISKPLVAHVNGPAGKHTYTINVEGTTMLVTCDMPHFVQEELPSLMQRAQIFGRTVLNVFSFFTTTVYRYMIEEAQLPNSSWHGIVYGCGVAQGVCTVGRLGDDSVNRIFNLIVRNPNIFLALDDLIRAGENVFLTRINCARAVDGLKKTLAPDKKTDTQWRIF